MTRTVRRYEVPVDGKPHGHELTGNPLHVAARRRPDDPVAHVVEFWAEHDDQAPPVKRRFQVFGTGHRLPEGARWRGTCDRLDTLVWHLFEVVGSADTP